MAVSPASFFRGFAISVFHRFLVEQQQSDVYLRIPFVFSVAVICCGQGNRTYRTLPYQSRVCDPVPLRHLLRIVEAPAIRILGNTLRAGEMKRLVDAAELIGTDTTTVLYKQCCNPGFIQDGVVFGMADGIRLAVMPFLPKEVDPIVDMEVESA